MLLVAINVEPTMLGELILELDEPLPPVGPTPRGISTTPMSEALSVAVIRLLECLKCPLDSRMLGRQTVREIVYRVLRGEQGGSLRALASRGSATAMASIPIQTSPAKLSSSRSRASSSASFPLMRCRVARLGLVSFNSTTIRSVSQPSTTTPTS